MRSSSKIVVAARQQMGSTSKRHPVAEDRADRHDHQR